MARLAALIVLILAVAFSGLLDAQNMTDREASYLRGQVRTIHLEFAEIDPQTNDWGPFKQQPNRVFDENGQLEGPVRDDGVLSTTVDDRGNWTEKVSLRRESSDREFTRTTIERRTITYY
jgi:hypothetical protein